MTRLVIQEGKREKGQEVGDSMELWQVEDSRPPWTAIVVSNLPADIRCRVTRVANAIDREEARLRVYTPVLALQRSRSIVLDIGSLHSTAGYIVFRVQVLPLKD